MEARGEGEGARSVGMRQGKGGCGRANSREMPSFEEMRCKLSKSNESKSAWPDVKRN